MHTLCRTTANAFGNQRNASTPSVTLLTYVSNSATLKNLLHSLAVKFLSIHSSELDMFGLALESPGLKGFYENPSPLPPDLINVLFS